MSIAPGSTDDAPVAPGCCTPMMTPCARIAPAPIPFESEPIRTGYSGSKMFRKHKINDEDFEWIGENLISLNLEMLRAQSTLLTNVITSRNTDRAFKDEVCDYLDHHLKQEYFKQYDKVSLISLSPTYNTIRSLLSPYLLHTIR